MIVLFSITQWLDHSITQFVFWLLASNELRHSAWMICTPFLRRHTARTSKLTKALANGEGQKADQPIRCLPLPYSQPSSLVRTEFAPGGAC